MGLLGAEGVGVTIEGVDVGVLGVVLRSSLTAELIRPMSMSSMAPPHLRP